MNNTEGKMITGKKMSDEEFEELGFNYQVQQRVNY